MKKYGIPVILVLMLIVAGLSGCSGSDLKVDISLPSGTYYGNQHVTLSCPDPAAQITYSLDGTDPAKSNIVYDPELGINISYTSDLKATAGGPVSEAHYDIIPYTDEKNQAQMDFFKKAEGTYSTDVSAQDNFIIKNSTVTFQEPGKPTVTSKYTIQDVNGNSANIIYSDANSQNVSVPVTVDPENDTITVNGKTYTKIWTLRARSEEEDY